MFTLRRNGVRRLLSRFRPVGALYPCHTAARVGEPKRESHHNAIAAGAPPLSSSKGCEGDASGSPGQPCQSAEGNAHEGSIDWAVQQFNTYYFTIRAPNTHTTTLRDLRPYVRFPIVSDTKFDTTSDIQEEAQLMKALQASVRDTEQGKSLPACAVVAALLAARVREWAGKISEDDESRRRLLNYIHSNYVVDDRLSSMLFAYLIHNSCNFCYDTIFTYFTKASAVKRSHQPLCKVLHDGETVQAFMRSHHVVTRREYLPEDTTLQGMWNKYTSRDLLAGYWVLPKHYDRSAYLERGGKHVLSRQLVPTDTVACVKARDNEEVGKKPGGSKETLIIGGDSGSGKTCALLAAGTMAQLHIVVKASELFNGDHTRATVVSRVRSFVHDTVKHVLEETTNCATDVLDVMLHVDEAGATYFDGKICNGHVVDRVRDVIFHRDALRAPGDEELAEMAKTYVVGMRIEVSFAGTGLDELYTGASGSIAGGCLVVSTRPPGKRWVRELVRDRFKERTGNGAAVEALMRQTEFTTVVATNHRLLRFALDELDTLLKPVFTELEKLTKDPVPSTDIISELLPRVDDAVKAMLPGACLSAAVEFVESNGLRGLSVRERRRLIRVAHVAYLKRSVLVNGDAATYEGVRQGLEDAGFTPLHVVENLALRGESQPLLNALALGVCTTTKKEVTRLDGCVAAGPSAETHVVVPRDEAPIVMSAGYRSLLRIIDKTVFNGRGPSEFEDVTFKLIVDALASVATVEGGCTYGVLLAAVCGPRYGLPVDKGAPSPPWKDPSFPHQRLKFSRAVEVRLPFKLSGAGLQCGILVECGKALLKELEYNMGCHNRQHRQVTQLRAALKHAQRAWEEVLHGGAVPAQCTPDERDEIERFYGHELKDGTVPGNELVDIADEIGVPFEVFMRKDRNVPRSTSLRVPIGAFITLGDVATSNNWDYSTLQKVKELNDIASTKDYLGVTSALEVPGVALANAEEERVRVPLHDLVKSEDVWEKIKTKAEWGDNRPPKLSKSCVVLPPRKKEYSREQLAKALGIHVYMLWLVHRPTSSKYEKMTLDMDVIKRQVQALNSLRSLLEDVMFLVVPREMSPSADAVLILIGHYLGFVQCKRLLKRILSAHDAKDEFRKCGLMKDSDDMAQATLQALKSVAGVGEVHDFFFILYRTAAVDPSARDEECLAKRVHFAEHCDAVYPAAGNRDDEYSRFIRGEL